MKIAIFYFTGTGNTEFIAKELKRALGNENPTELFSIEFFVKGVSQSHLGQFDFLILGAPVYAFNAPRIFINFLKRLPKGDGKRVMLFLDAGGDALAGLAYPSRLLGNKGYNVTNQAVFFVPANLWLETVDKTNGIITANLFGWRYQQNVKEMLELSRVKIQATVNKILKGEPTSFPTSFFTQHISIGAWFIYAYLGCPTFKYFIRTNQACNLCGICISTCPTNNIRIEKSKVIFGSACTMCYRCINVCPKLAISFRSPFGFMDNKAQYLCSDWKVPIHENRI